MTAKRPGAPGSGVGSRAFREGGAAEAGARGAQGLPVILTVMQVVDTREIHEHLELQPLRIAQRTADRSECGGLGLVSELVRE